MGTEGSTDGAPRPALRRKWWLVTGIAGVAIAALLTTLINTATRDENVAVVEDFFAALAERDVKTALSLVDPKDVPSGDEAAFLKPEAIAQNWSLASAKLKKRTASAAFVTAEFDTEGLNFGAEFKVLTGRNPKLDYPFILVDFGYSPLKYAQANDRTVPMDSMSENEVAQYALLPGSYTFYGDAPDSVKTQHEPMLFDLFDDHNLLDEVILPEPFSLKSSVKPDLRTEFDELLTECVKSRKLHPTDCPFGTQDWAITHDGSDVSNPRSVEWKLTDKPEISFDEYGSYGDVEGIAVTTTPLPRPVTLTGTGENDEGKSVKFTAECSIDSETWVVMINADGEPELDNYRPETKPAEFQTCDRFT